MTINPDTAAPPSPQRADLEDERVARIRKQFDGAPYPRTAIDVKPQNRRELWFHHCVTTAYYIRDGRPPAIEEMTILDVGCGSGMKALVLAICNPGAKVIGIDFSEKSIDLARKRAELNDLSDAVEFHTLGIEELATLNTSFDYINCDEVLYLLPDPTAALRWMKAALNPEGIIRTNLHNLYQRSRIYNTQAGFEILGLSHWDNQQEGIDEVEKVLRVLRPDRTNIANTWGRYKDASETTRAELIAANVLLEGDRGFTIPETRSLLADSGLAFNQLLEPHRWDVDRLFEDDIPDELRARWQTLDPFDRLHLHELLATDNRLIDFWCSPVPTTERPAAKDWDDPTWDTHVVALHPLLQSQEFRDRLVECARTLKALDLAKHFTVPRGLVMVSGQLVPALLPLLDGPQPLDRCLLHLLTVLPTNPVTGSPSDRDRLKRSLQNLFSELELAGYILLPPADSVD